MVKQKTARTQAKKLLDYALENGWELRAKPGDLWVIARGILRIFAQFDENGRWVSGLLVHGLTEKEIDIDLRKAVTLIKKKGWD